MREHVPWVQGSLLLDALERGGGKWGCGHAPGWRWGYFCLDNRCGYRHMGSCQPPGLRPRTQALPLCCWAGQVCQRWRGCRPAWPTCDGGVGTQGPGGQHSPAPSPSRLPPPTLSPAPLPIIPQPQAQSHRLLVVTSPVATSASLSLWPQECKWPMGLNVCREMIHNRSKSNAFSFFPE